MSNVEWQEVMATAFAVPSPALKTHVGMPIMGSRGRVDAFGLVFFNDASLCAKGGARKRWHDTLTREVFTALREGEVSSDREVEGLFRDLIPRGSRAAYLRGPGPRAYPYSQRREGLVPDLRFRHNLVYTLADVKTMGFGETRYGPPGRTRGRQPPDMRADKVHAEYLAKARALDRNLVRKWCGTPLGQGLVGPVERRLVSFGQVAGIVFYRLFLLNLQKYSCSRSYYAATTSKTTKEAKKRSRAANAAVYACTPQITCAGKEPQR